MALGAKEKDAYFAKNPHRAASYRCFWMTSRENEEHHQNLSQSIYLHFQEVIHANSPGHDSHLAKLKHRAKEVKERTKKFWIEFTCGIPEDAMLYYVEYEADKDSFVGYYFLLDGIVIRKGNHEDHLMDLFVK